VNYVLDASAMLAFLLSDMIVHLRAARSSLSLADAFGIALAGRFGCEFVSGDHADMDQLLPLGLCKVRFIR
jgi:predicted nucleic acid-binding protein